MRTFASIVGTTAYTLTVLATAAYVGNWGGHERAFSAAILAVGAFFLLASIASGMKKDPSGG